MSKKLVLLELNEINFDYVKKYIDMGIELKGFNLLFNKGIIKTSSEEKYELLEPWIQWPSVHTGMTYNEHKIFRLGDIINFNHNQIFEKVESLGFNVGAISPMNASNRMTNATYFIPDPWTNTEADKSFLSRKLAKALNQAVNDNSSSKLTPNTIATLCISFIALVSPLRWIPLSLFALSCYKKPWRKALFLDKFLFEIHKRLFKKGNTDFTTLFLNAGAHIQHHYFFNSQAMEIQSLKNPEWYIKCEEDPFLEMIKEYDKMIQDITSLKDIEVIISTGLSQKPYDELKYYYRLKDHKEFLGIFDIPFEDISPRMTRDFLVEFKSSKEALLAKEKLEMIKVNHTIKLFEEIEIRDNELFIVLTYPNKIDNDTTISFEDNILKLKSLVTFVAIKNGEHQSKGFAYFSDGLKKYQINEEQHVSNIHNSIFSFFDDKAKQIS